MVLNLNMPFTKYRIGARIEIIEINKGFINMEYNIYVVDYTKVFIHICIWYFNYTGDLIKGKQTSCTFLS